MRTSRNTLDVTSERGFDDADSGREGKPGTEKPKDQLPSYHLYERSHTVSFGYWERAAKEFSPPVDPVFRESPVSFGFDSHDVADFPSCQYLHRRGDTCTSGQFSGPFTGVALRPPYLVHIKLVRS